MSKKLPKGIADLLESVGVKAEEVINEPPTGEYQRLERAQFHAEAVLHFLSYPSVDRIVKRCKECREPFATYYKSVAYCDYPCLKAGLKKAGLLWKETEYDYDSKTNVERWGGMEPPLVIPPAAIAAMRELIRQVDEGNHQLSNENKETVSQPEIVVKSVPVVLPNDEQDVLGKTSDLLGEHVESAIEDFGKWLDAQDL